MCRQPLNFGQPFHVGVPWSTITMHMQFIVSGGHYNIMTFTCATKPKIPIMNNIASQSIRVGTTTGVFVAIILKCNDGVGSLVNAGYKIMSSRLTLQ